MVARPARAGGSFDIAGIELVRGFVEHLAEQRSSAVPTSVQRIRAQIDWGVLEAAVAESTSIEQAIGRAIALADRMCRGVSDEPEAAVTTSDKVEQPFFAFSVADVVPDFGDHSRYRTRVAKRFARIFSTRRQSDDEVGAAALVSAESLSP